MSALPQATFPQDGPFRLSFHLERASLVIEFGLDTETPGGESRFVAQTHAVVEGIRYLQCWTDHDAWSYDELYFAASISDDPLARLVGEAATTASEPLDRLRGLRGLAVEGMGVLVELLHEGEVNHLHGGWSPASGKPRSNAWTTTIGQQLTVSHETVSAGTQIDLRLEGDSVDLHFVPGVASGSLGSARRLRLGRVTELRAWCGHGGADLIDSSVHLTSTTDEFRPTHPSAGPKGVTRTAGPFAGRRLDDSLSADRRPQYRASIAIGSLRAQVLHADEPVWTEE